LRTLDRSTSSFPFPSIPITPAIGGINFNRTFECVLCLAFHPDWNMI
jgi:hypothetical protein